MSKTIYKDLKNAAEDKIKDLLEESQGQITGSNYEALGALIDIHKDIANEEYWCYKMEEGENMYGNYGRGGSYGNYGRGGSYNEGYGRGGSYNEGYGEYNERGYGEYGARGRGRSSRGRYRGHDYLDEMYEDYGRYMEGRERYGANEETSKSYHYMIKALEDFIKVLEEEADSQEQKEMLHQALQNAVR